MSKPEFSPEAEAFARMAIAMAVEVVRPGDTLTTRHGPIEIDGHVVILEAVVTLAD